MANDPQFNSKSVETAEAILQDLKAKAKQAHEQEDVFMMGILTELIGVASPIVTRAVARLNRMERAKINAAHKDLRAKAREQSAKSEQG